MRQYTKYSNHIIENFIATTSPVSVINTIVLSLQEIIIALQHQEPITSEVFIVFQSLINNISITTSVYTSYQNDIINQINLLKEQKIPSSLFIAYAIRVIPVNILPSFFTLYKKLLDQLIPDYIISFEQINNTNILVPIVKQILSVPPQTTPPTIPQITPPTIPPTISSTIPPTISSTISSQTISSILTPSKSILIQLHNKLLVEPIKNIISNFRLYLASSCIIFILVIIIIILVNKKKIIGY
jgi:hypothetical protein